MIWEISDNLLDSLVQDVLAVWGNMSIFDTTVSIIGVWAQILNLLFNVKLPGFHYSIKSNQ